jgi:hypothetical protein
MNYADAIAYLNNGKNKNDRPLANNTRLIRNGEDVAIRLHSTDIIILHPDGSETLTSGGWRTATTKERINKYSSLHVYQDKGVWYYGGWERGNRHVFYDGIVVKGGTVISEEKESDERVARIKKWIDAYMVKFNALEKIPEPSLGDCFVCGMTPEGSYPDCLESHLEEGYIHGRLIMNALHDTGYRDPSFIYQFGGKKMIARALRRYFKRALGIAR